MYNKNTHTGPSFSLKNRFYRVLWKLSYILLFRYSPTPCHKWRSTILKLFGAKVGLGVHVYPKVQIWAPWNLELDDFCGVANGVTLYSQGKITLGRWSVVSQGSHLVTGTHDYTQEGFPLIIKPINIGSQCWIATEAFIHPGITIGEGCVIGARSVVIKDMPVWTVCSGHPCKPIKKRVMKEIEHASTRPN